MAQAFIAKGKRAKFILTDAHLLRRGDEKRHHFKLGMVLTEGDDTLTGLPEWVQNAYTNLVQTGNLTDLQKFNVRLENMAIEMWPTPKARARFFSVIIGATLSNFVMTREGEGDDDAVITLNFSAYFPARKEIHDWTFDHRNADFWASFEQQQGELNLAGPEAMPDRADVDTGDDEEAEEEDEPDELAAQAARRAAREAPAQPSAQAVADAKRKLSLM